ncbi:hypothetical protein C0J52_16304 [Blattella germanica]|nr:hypothetical protein C0J52_16304 [Blattella germanica]
MWDVVEYLKDPHLVANVQKYYGVKVLHSQTVANGNVDSSLLTDEKTKLKKRLGYDQEENSINSNAKTTDGLNSSNLDTRSNGRLSNEVDGEETVSSESESECKGQGIKDVVRWPRPSCPPVVRLQKKWALEYGMPSTHAMVGVSIPFSVILYTMNRYQDIVVGVFLALALMVPVVPLVDALDYYLLTSQWSPFILLTIGICTIVFYPSRDRWTPTRGDTTMVVSVCVGVHIGAWTNYQLGVMREYPDPPPYAIIWPSYEMLGLSALRTVIGFCCIVATRALCKSASYATVCTLLRLNSRELKKSQNSIENSQKITVELSYKFITYALLGFNTLYLLPNVFRLIGIERPTFYTEI